jgi:hypothetical protein
MTSRPTRIGIDTILKAFKDVASSMGRWIPESCRLMETMHLLGPMVDIVVMLPEVRAVVEPGTNSVVPEDPVNDQILESEEDREQREYEEEAQAYFDALDYAFDKIRDQRARYRITGR